MPGSSESYRIHYHLEDETLTRRLLQEVLHNLWQQKFPDHPAPQQFDFLWERSDRKVLLYVFTDELPTPVFFGKSSDNKSVAKRLHQEAITNYLNVFLGNKDEMDIKMVQQWQLFGDPSLKVGGY